MTQGGQERGVTHRCIRDACLHMWGYGIYLVGGASASHLSLCESLIMRLFLGLVGSASEFSLALSWLALKKSTQGYKYTHINLSWHEMRPLPHAAEK